MAILAKYEQVTNILKDAIGETPISIKELSGGFTNSSFLVQTTKQQLVVRIPGEGTNSYISRLNEMSNLAVLEGYKFIPIVEYANSDNGILITHYLSNSIPARKEHIYKAEYLYGMCRTLVDLHSSGITFCNKFDYEEMLEEYRLNVARCCGGFPSALLDAAPLLDSGLDLLNSCDEQYAVPCHGDPKLNNFLFCDSRVFLIDWEYSGMASPYFDIVNFIMTNNLNLREESIFLQMYTKCSREPINKKLLLLNKIATDYVWIYWHLLKLAQGEMVEYNSHSWKNRLKRACANLDQIQKGYL